MTKTIKRPYIAPAAELILLAPMEALAAPVSQDDSIALNKWGFNKWKGSVIPNASVTGGKQTYWREDGTIP